MPDCVKLFNSGQIDVRNKNLMSAVFVEITLGFVLYRCRIFFHENWHISPIYSKSVRVVSLSSEFNFLILFIMIPKTTKNFEKHFSYLKSF